MWKNGAVKIRWDIEKSILDNGLKLLKSSKRHVSAKLVIEYLGFKRIIYYKHG